MRCFDNIVCCSKKRAMLRAVNKSGLKQLVNTEALCGECKSKSAKYLGIAFDKKDCIIEEELHI